MNSKTEHHGSDEDQPDEEMAAIRRHDAGIFLYAFARRGTLRHIAPALMSRFVLRLFTHCILGSDYFTEAMMIVWLDAFCASRHSFIAGRQ